MKKRIAGLLAIVLLLSLAACGPEPENTEVPSAVSSTDASTTAPSAETTEPSSDTATSSESMEKPADNSFTMDLTGITTLEELETRIEEHLASTIASLNAQWEALAATIDTYQKYVENAEQVSSFYQTVVEETDQMCILLYEYSAAYARMVLDSDMSDGDKYDAIEGINDCLYEDACDEINDEIYDGLLDDMNDYFYNGILEDAQDDVDYSDWYDVCSKEYDQWYDTSSEVYGLYYDTASEIYSFYCDMSSELYSGDYERAEKVYERFLEKIAKAKGQETGGTNTEATFDTALRTAGSTEEMETIIETHVTECTQALWNEWETMAAEIDTFDEYKENVDSIEAFHTHIEEAASQILVMICDYGAAYAGMIIQSDSSPKDMYNSFEDFKDCLYEDACEIVKDEIYEDLLGEMKDYYYEGIIQDAKDSVQYSEWSDARSDAYNWWSDARGAVYSSWSDTRGDLYSFYSDIRSELYRGDTDGAADELQNFKDKIAEMK